MALGLLGGAARAVGGQMAKSGGKAMAKKVMNRGDKKQKKSVSGGSAQQNEGMSGASTIRPKTTLIPASVVKASDTKTTSVGSDGILVTIYKRVVEIDKILKGTLAEEKALTKEKTKQDKKEDRDKKEGKLEKKKTKEEKKQKGLSLPGLSFFDRIKKFITTIIGGFILQKLVDFGPEKLEGIILAINTGLDVGVKAILGVIDAAGTFLLGAYDLYDQTKDWVGVKEGEDAKKKFGQFGEKLKNLLNAILIVGGAAIALGPKGPKPKPRGPNLAPAAANAVAASRNTSFMGPGRYRLPGQTAAGSSLNLEMARRSASSTFTPARASRFAGFKANLQTGTAGVPLPAGAQRGLFKAGSKAGQFLSKASLPGIKNIFGRIPWIGTLIVTVASLLAGEPIGQAAFKGFGAALGGILGSFIPIPVIGTTIGLLAGEFVGDLLYSLILGKGPEEAGRKLKAAFDNALMVGGLIGEYFKESFGRLFKNFPTIDVSDVGWGALQKALAVVLPFLDEDKDGKVEKIPDISILNPIFNPVGFVSKLIPHAAASFFPAIFGKGGTAFGGSKKAPDNEPEKLTGSTGAGSNLAGEAGKFIESKLSSPKDYQAITEHPDFGGIRGGHSANSYHYSGRAIDIGAWDYEQGPIVDVINQFNKMKNVSPAEIITAKQDPTYHGDHVHVAYNKGGYVDKDGIVHKGEHVIDIDSSVPKVSPMLLAINAATDEKGVMKAISDYAPYEALGESTIVINQNQIPASMMQQKQSPSAPIVIPVGGEDPFASTYANC